MIQIMKEIYRQYENGNIIVGPTEISKNSGREAS